MGLTPGVALLKRSWKGSIGRVGVVLDVGRGALSESGRVVRSNKVPVILDVGRSAMNRKGEEAKDGREECGESHDDFRLRVERLNGL